MGSPKIDRLISDFRNLSDKEILFEENEIEILNRIKENVIPERIIYCSFENRFAKSGGLAAVVASLLPYLDITVKNNLKSSEVILLTPFHSKQKAFHDAIESNSLVKKMNFSMPYKGKEINVDIYEFKWNYDLGSRKTGTIKEYYLKSDNIFETQNKLGDPYIYDTEDLMRNNDLIIRDSIFFCKAAPFALKHLGYCENIIFHLQEWQTALIALTSKLAMLPGRLDKDILLKSSACIQTMHNTFDSYESPGFFLEQFKNIANYYDEDKLYMLSYKHILEKSFSEYSIGLSFIDKKITTVSKCFAEEITTDILHTEYFAPHIQSKLKSGGKVKGVNNGMFLKMPREFDFVFDKNQNDNEKINKLKEIKFKNRINLLTILSDYNSENTFGKLLYKNMEITELPDNVPICVMSGRLDPSQKGYDILLKVIDEFHNEQIKNGEEKIKFILTPMPIKLSDLDYFKEIAGKCKGNLLVIAERMKKGYLELQLGSTFGLMPSIFEPFGAAIEYMVNGTLVIARNTGGLRDQITDGVDGLLYSEGSAGTKSAEYNIENIRHYFQYRNNVKIPLAENNWAKAMVQSLKTKIEEAITIFINPDKYFQMVLKGFEKATEFSWYKSAEEYYEYYKKI